MDDLERALKKRNARLRAWRAHGAPIKGGWEKKPNPRGAVLYVLTLECSRCARLGRWLTFLPKLFGIRFEYLGVQRVIPASLATPVVLEELEKGALFQLTHPTARECCDHQACPHLLPLLAEDPPFVRSLYELELPDGG